MIWKKKKATAACWIRQPEQMTVMSVHPKRDNTEGTRKECALTSQGSTVIHKDQTQVDVCAHLKRGLPGQTLEHDGSYAPQVSLGIVGLRHDDFRSLAHRGKERGTHFAVTHVKDDGRFLVSERMGCGSLPCTWGTYIMYLPLCCSGGIGRTHSQLHTRAERKIRVLNPPLIAILLNITLQAH